MTKIISKGKLSVFIVLGILLLDQILKIEIKTSMYYGENIRITDWFYLSFIENPGMAFGIQIIPKAIQTIFRLLFAGAIIWYIALLIRAGYKRSYIVCVSLVLAGAIGNIVDSLFYGVIFSQSTFSEIATFVPVGEGYAGWMYGKVVDMLYFPLLQSSWPDWMPVVGGGNFIFFSPVFNIADASVCCGMLLLLLFYNRSFSNSLDQVKNEFKRLIHKAHS